MHQVTKHGQGWDKHIGKDLERIIHEHLFNCTDEQSLINWVVSICFKSITLKSLKNQITGTLFYQLPGIMTFTVTLWW